jgi:hypothetical protein
MPLTEVRLHSSLYSLPDVITVSPVTIRFATAAFDRRSLWRFGTPPPHNGS